MAIFISSSVPFITSVIIGSLLTGGVPIIEISLIPSSARFKVLGIGVAVSVRTSSFCLFFFNVSFAFTPNFCSSSIISSPTFLNSTSSLKSLWVPITISTIPLLSFFSISFDFPCVSLDRFSIVTG